MSVASLLEGMRAFAVAALYWIIDHDVSTIAAIALVLAAIAGLAIHRGRRRRTALARAARLQWGIHDLKEQLRRRLADPRSPFADDAATAPTLGAAAGFEADIEAAANSVLLDAGGRRAKAKHLLRERLKGNGNGSLNGSEAGYWRQLGALSLLDNTQDALKAYSRAAQLRPDDAQSHMLLGLLYLRADRLEAAEAAFRRQMELANGSVETARHRGGILLGDVLAAKSEREAALAAYDEARRNAEAMAEGEPDNPALQRDISIAHDRIADVLLAQGQLELALDSCRHSLGIAEALAARDPANVEWQRDLSVAHDRVGEVLERMGDLDGALESFRKGLALAETLARRGSERLDWQWDVSVSLDRIGDVLSAKGNIGEALAAYRRGLGIAQDVAELEPGRTGWQRDLAVSYHKIGSLEAVNGNEGEARDLLERGRSIIAHLDRIAFYQAQWRADLSKFDEALRRLGP